MKTALNATKLAIAAFIVPYIMAYSPAMVLVDTNFIEVVGIVISSILGMFGVAAALNGHLFRPIPMLLRLAICAGGLMMMVPGALTDAIGIALVGGIFAFQYFGARKVQAA